MVWSKYDPYATGFIPVKDLEAFIMDMCRTTEGKNLIIYHDRVLQDEMLRERFIGLLNIPTYF